MNKQELDNVEIPPRVVFVNLKDGNVFFDCSPVEARKAMDDIKKYRQGKLICGEKADEVAKVRELVHGHKKRTLSLYNEGESKLSIEIINKAFVNIEKYDRIVQYICMNPLTYAQIRAWGKGYYEEATSIEELRIGLFGRLWTADILVSTNIKNGIVYTVSLEKNKKFDPLVIKTKMMDLKTNKIC